MYAPRLCKWGTLLLPRSATEAKFRQHLPVCMW